MRTIYILVEGQTEEEFVNCTISPYLKQQGIQNTVPILLETSPGYYGGDVTFARYNKNAQNLLTSDPNCIVTSLIDYHELRSDFPDYEEAMKIANKIDSVQMLEKGLQEHFNNPCYIPYIQLHEFESLLFSDIKGFNYITTIPAKVTQINAIVSHYSNPELINSGKTTVPSARLKAILPRYKKPFHGPIVALENGIGVVLQRCPRFKVWVELMITSAST